MWTSCMKEHFLLEKLIEDQLQVVVVVVDVVQGVPYVDVVFVDVVDDVVVDDLQGVPYVDDGFVVVAAAVAVDDDVVAVVVV